MSRPMTASKTRTLDAATMASLHNVLLGSETRDMPDAWRGGFTFREHGLLCGLRQRQGGGQPA